MTELEAIFVTIFVACALIVLIPTVALLYVGIRAYILKKQLHKMGVTDKEIEDYVKLDRIKRSDEND